MKENLIRINNISSKLYEDVQKRGIEAIKELFSEKGDLSDRLKYDKELEYIKKMVISQLNLGLLVFNEDNQTKNTIINTINYKYDSDILEFDDQTIEKLFGNKLGISTDEEYREWSNYLNDSKNEEYINIHRQEKMKYEYEHEKNPFKKIHKYFKLRKEFRQNNLESSYSKRIFSEAE